MKKAHEAAEVTRRKVGHTEEAMERRRQAFPQNHTLPSPPVLSLGITARHVALPSGARFASLTFDGRGISI